MNILGFKITITSSHVCPQHMESDKQRSLYYEGEKSLFIVGTTEEDIAEVIIEAIVFPMLQFMKFLINISGTTGYRIYKR